MVRKGVQMAMLEIAVGIQGSSPLMLRKFGDAESEEASSGARKRTKADLGTPRQQADACLYKDEKGKLIIPSVNVFQCIIAGGSFFKQGRTSITTQRASLIPACVIMHEIHVELKHKDPWTVDTIPATGGRILRHRPLFNDWGFDFTVSLDTDYIGEKLFREIVDAAGARVGFGEYRPACRGPYGRFKVNSWTSKELKAAA
jgi:hypothetical protein